MTTIDPQIAQAARERLLEILTRFGDVSLEDRIDPLYWGHNECRCCKHVWRITSGGTTVIAQRQDCACSGLFCETCKQCIVHHTCGVPHPFQ